MSAKCRCRVAPASSLPPACWLRSSQTGATRLGTTAFPSRSPAGACCARSVLSAARSGWSQGVALAEGVRIAACGNATEAEAATVTSVFHQPTISVSPVRTRAAELVSAEPEPRLARAQARARSSVTIEETQNRGIKMLVVKQEPWGVRLACLSVAA